MVPPFPSAFGELALFYSAPRAATVRAMKPCKLWVMERDVFVAIKQSLVEKVEEEKRQLLANTRIFKGLSEDSQSKLLDVLELVSWGGKL